MSLSYLVATQTGKNCPKEFKHGRERADSSRVINGGGFLGEIVHHSDSQGVVKQGHLQFNCIFCAKCQLSPINYEEMRILRNARDDNGGSTSEKETREWDMEEQNN